MARPRIPRTFRGGRAAASLDDFTLQEGPSLAGRRLPNPGRRAPTLTFVAGLRTLAQRGDLPIHGPGEPGTPQRADDDEQGDFLGTSSPILLGVMNNSSEQYARKKERQWGRWANKVIPDLLGPYLEYLASTAGGKEAPAPPPCSCGRGRRELQVVAIHWERKWPDYKYFR